MNKSLYIAVAAMTLAGCASPEKKLRVLAEDHAVDIADGKRDGKTVVVFEKGEMSVYNEYAEYGRVAAEGYAKREGSRDFIFYKEKQGMTNGVSYVDATYPKLGKPAAAEAKEVVQPKEEEKLPVVVVQPATYKRVIMTRLTIEGDKVPVKE